MNYYHFAYEPAPPGELRLSAHMVAADEPDTWELQIALTSEALDAAARPPMNVTLVLDTSGSMAGTPVELLKETCRAIAASLKEGDVVSMVEWDTSNTWSLAAHVVDGPNDATLLAEIEGLQSGGGTDLNGGLTSGYQLAQTAWDPDRINRVVLISDGGANAGVTDIELIAANAEWGGLDGIYLVGAGVGGGEYNDELLDRVTDAGKGASAYVFDAAEAWRVFHDDFENTMAVAARDVQVEITMPPGFEIVDFSGEEWSENPIEIEPQHIGPNDSMVFFQRVRTCAPELVEASTEIAIKATFKDAITFEEHVIEQSSSLTELAANEGDLLAKGRAIFSYAEALKTHQGLAGAATLEKALADVEFALSKTPDDEDLLQIHAILMVLH
jgi:Ca-activated chloride channel family protein